jgi:hypothetical protein
MLRDTATIQYDQCLIPWTCYFGISSSPIAKNRFLPKERLSARANANGWSVPSNQHGGPHSMVRFIPGALFCCYAATTALAQAPSSVRVQEVEAVLLTPLASYSQAGQRFELRTSLPLHFGAAPLLPPGTILRGTVRKANRIGYGIRRERAQLELDFDPVSHPGNPAIQCSVRLAGIDNAREQVGRDNRINGILAASSPNSLLQGIWFRPPSAILQRGARGATGLTGPVGALQSRLAPHPIGAAITVVSRILLFSLPNAEIELPPGTQLILRIAVDDGFESLVALTDVPPAAQPMSLSPDDEEYLRQAPTDIRNASGMLVADRINFAFFGDQPSIAAAFGAAGWKPSDPLTRKSFARSYSAFTSMRSYDTAPVSPLHYQRRLPDLVFQRSFNTMSKRHHIRLWKVEAPPGASSDSSSETTLWLGAATHDIGIAFDWSRFSLTHRVDTFLDTERSKVLNDLSAVRCLRKLTLLDRPAFDGGAATDGKLAVAEVQPCESSVASAQQGPMRLLRPSIPIHQRLSRRLVLETRQHFIRGSAYYWTYRGVRRVATALRRAPSHSNALAGKAAPSIQAPAATARSAPSVSAPPRANSLR